MQSGVRIYVNVWKWKWIFEYEKVVKLNYFNLLNNVKDSAGTEHRRVFSVVLMTYDNETS